MATDLMGKTFVANAGATEEGKWKYTDANDVITELNGRISKPSNPSHLDLLAFITNDWAKVAQSWASGDLLFVNDNSGTLEWKRLPKGTDGQILQLASGLPSWQNKSIPRTRWINYSYPYDYKYVDITFNDVTVTQASIGGGRNYQTDTAGALTDMGESYFDVNHRYYFGTYRPTIPDAYYHTDFELLCRYESPYSATIFPAISSVDLTGVTSPTAGTFVGYNGGGEFGDTISKSTTDYAYAHIASYKTNKYYAVINGSGNLYVGGYSVGQSNTYTHVTGLKGYVGKMLPSVITLSNHINEFSQLNDIILTSASDGVKINDSDDLIFKGIASLNISITGFTGAISSDKLIDIDEITKIEVTGGSPIFQFTQLMT